MCMGFDGSPKYQMSNSVYLSEVIWEKCSLTTEFTFTALCKTWCFLLVNQKWFKPHECSTLALNFQLILSQSFPIRLRCDNFPIVQTSKLFILVFYYFMKAIWKKPPKHGLMCHKHCLKKPHVHEISHFECSMLFALKLVSQKMKRTLKFLQDSFNTFNNIWNS